MTKEAFIAYLTEAVEAMDEQNIEALFPQQNQPDLYTLLEAITGLRGEVKKIAQTSLRLQNEVQHLVEKQQIQAEKQEQKKEVKTPVQSPASSNQKDTKDLKYILRELIKLEAVIQKTSDGLDGLPEVSVFSLGDYKTRFAAWESGYKLFEKQWKALIKSTGMYQTGLVGTQFDPTLHEAVATAYNAEKTENTILETEQIGWIYKQKSVQQAKVVVNKKRKKHEK